MSEHELADEFEDFAGELPDSVDQAAVDRMRLVARLLDDAVRIPGTDYRIGLDPIASVAPVAGDVVTGVVSLYIVAESARLGVSYKTLVKMLINVSIDVAGGSIPFVGPIFDAAWKSNVRNVKLVVEELQAQAEAQDGLDDRDEEPMTIEVE